MFSGIIEDIGTLESKKSSSLTIRTRLSDVKKGDSISVNGTCLTVIDIKNKHKGTDNSITFDFSPETSLRTNLQNMRISDKVNLESAMKFGDKIGGHFLTGHIEEVGKIARIEQKDNSMIFSITHSKNISKYIAEKGSIGVDGISLTVMNKNESCFKVSIIPYTLRNTTLGSKKAGDSVNLEPDILAKYLENVTDIKQKQSSLNKDLLKQNGFF